MPWGSGVSLYVFSSLWWLSHPALRGWRFWTLAGHGCEGQKQGRIACPRCQRRQGEALGGLFEGKKKPSR